MSLQGDSRNWCCPICTSQNVSEKASCCKCGCPQPSHSKRKFHDAPNSPEISQRVSKAAKVDTSSSANRPARAWWTKNAFYTVAPDAVTPDAMTPNAVTPVAGDAQGDHSTSMDLTSAFSITGGPNAMTTVTPTPTSISGAGQTSMISASSSVKNSRNPTPVQTLADPGSLGTTISQSSVLADSTARVDVTSPDTQSSGTGSASSDHSMALPKPPKGIDLGSPLIAPDDSFMQIPCEFCYSPYPACYLLRHSSQCLSNTQVSDSQELAWKLQSQELPSPAVTPGARDIHETSGENPFSNLTFEDMFNGELIESLMGRAISGKWRFESVVNPELMQDFMFTQRDFGRQYADDDKKSGVLSDLKRLESRFENFSDGDIDRSGGRLVRIAPRMVFHGTTADSLTKILKEGFRIPDGVSVRMRTGAAFGRGMYFARKPQLALNYADYCRNGGGILICAALQGKIYRCIKTMSGRPLQDGYDSHCSRNGDIFVLFKTGQVFPLFVAKMGANT